MRWGRALALVLALIGVVALIGPVAAQDPVSPEELAERLRRARDLSRLDDAGPSEELMAELRDALGLPTEVAIGDWVTVIPPDPLLEGLSGTDAADFDTAADRLTALERSLSDAIARGGPDTVRISEALDEAYRGVVPPRPDLFQAFLQTIRDVIEAIAQRIGNVVANAGAVLAWVVLAAMAIFAIAFLFRSRLVPDRVVASGGGGHSGAGSIDWAARAEDAIRAGDLHEATRALYLSLLAVLAGRGIVADAPALTAGEARFAVQRSRPGLFPAVARATDSYERVVYGGATPDVRDIEQLRDATAQARGR